MRAVVVALLLCVAPRAVAQQPPATAQQPPTLADLQQRALAIDPRARQTEILRAQSALREQSLRAERYPALSVEALAQYQSDVTTFGGNLPPGAPVPKIPHDTYDARLNARQPIFDPTLNARVNVERAQLAQSAAQVEVSLYSLRQSVNEAWFNALLLQTQRGEVDLAIEDLQAQLRVARERVAAGTALRSEANTLEAEILRRRQSRAELDVNRAAALEILADLTGVRIDPRDTLRAPELSTRVRDARAQIARTSARPEYEQFTRLRETLEAQERLSSAQDLPRVSAFGRLGYGRPGLDMLNTNFDSYWIVGLQLEWTPFTWGTTRREREVLALQRDIARTEEEAFRAQLERTIVRDAADIDRLADALADDERIIALREQILAEARIRFAEGVITSAEYVDRQTDLVDARLTRSLHRAQLAEAQARLLTTLGLEVR